MKFGISTMVQHPMNDSSVDRFQQVVEQTRLARDAGFDTISSGHHYLSPPFQSLQSIPLMSRLAADSGDMNLTLGIILLALLNPVQVAEDVATLDIISGGRVIFGIGLGYRDEEFEAFGVKKSDGVARMLESLELIKRLWTEQDVTFEGKFFQVHNATSTIRPVQKPHPPIWIAANADRAVIRAGRLGYPWAVNPHAALSTIARQMDRYKEALDDAGHSVPEDMPMLVEMHTASSREEAIEIARPFLEAKYLAYADWGQDRVLPGEESFRINFDSLAEDRFILGSPQDVIDGIEHRSEVLGCNHFIFRLGWPGMEHEKVMRVIELTGERVLPYFRSKYGVT